MMVKRELKMEKVEMVDLKVKTKRHPEKMRREKEKVVRKEKKLRCLERMRSRFCCLLSSSL